MSKNHFTYLLKVEITTKKKKKLETQNIRHVMEEISIYSWEKFQKKKKSKKKKNSKINK